MVFEYDENKNQANIKKHGIDFEEAISVFSDPFLRISKDDSQLKKKDSLRSVDPKKNKLYLSSTATESKKIKKKLSESSPLEKSPNLKKKYGRVMILKTCLN